MSLEYLAPALLTAVVERLHQIVRPKSYMLAFFHADDKQEAVPFYTFRIQGVTTRSGGSTRAAGVPRNFSTTAVWKSCSANLNL